MGGLRCDEVSHGAARLSGSGSAGRREAMISSRVGGRGRIGCRQGNRASSSFTCKCIIIIIKVEPWPSRFLSPRVRSPAHTPSHRGSPPPSLQHGSGVWGRRIKVRLLPCSLSRCHPLQPKTRLLGYLASHWQRARPLLSPSPSCNGDADGCVVVVVAGLLALAEFLQQRPSRPKHRCQV